MNDDPLLVTNKRKVLSGIHVSYVMAMLVFVIMIEVGFGVFLLVRIDSEQVRSNYPAWTQATAITAGVICAWSFTLWFMGMAAFLRYIYAESSRFQYPDCPWWYGRIPLWVSVMDHLFMWVPLIFLVAIPIYASALIYALIVLHYVLYFTKTYILFKFRFDDYFHLWWASDGPTFWSEVRLSHF